MSDGFFDIVYGTAAPGSAAINPTSGLYSLASLWGWGPIARTISYNLLSQRDTITVNLIEQESVTVDLQDSATVIVALQDADTVTVQTS